MVVRRRRVNINQGVEGSRRDPPPRTAKISFSLSLKSWSFRFAFNAAFIFAIFCSILARDSSDSVKSKTLQHFFEASQYELSSQSLSGSRWIKGGSTSMRCNDLHLICCQVVPQLSKLQIVPHQACSREAQAF